MTSQSNSSRGRDHDRMPNWNPKNGGMLISQPISSCLTNHNELCMSRLLNNQPRRISIYRLQRRPSFGFESSASSTPMTSGETLWVTRCDPIRHVSSSSGLATAVSELLYQCYFTYFHLLISLDTSCSLVFWSYTVSVACVYELVRVWSL